MTTAPTIEAVPVARSFLRVTGADARAYLQGQLSQDLDVVDSQGGAPSFLLDPGGKVVSLLRIVRTGDAYVLDTDEAAGAATEARLRRFLLRVDVDIEALEGWECVRLFGAPQLPQASTTTVWPSAPFPQELTGPEARALADGLGGRWLEAAEGEQRRIAAGLPVSGVDIGAETIPGEVGGWAIDSAVSFTKGCYTGQELVARIDSRGGNVPRPLRGLVAAADGALTAPATLHADGKQVGQLTSAAGAIALGPVGRGVVPGAVVMAVSNGREVPVRVEELPLVG